MLETARVFWGGALRGLLLIASTGVVSCGGNDLNAGRLDHNGPADNYGPTAQTPDAPAPEEFVKGVKLAVVNLSPTQSVELWESEPGMVLMLQKWDAASGEQSLSLAQLFREGGGTYGGLYRKLLNDPNALLSPELIAADERWSHSPIRDASLPRPATPTLPSTLGQAAAPPAPATTAPNTLVPLAVKFGITKNGGGILPQVDPNVYCRDPETEGGWCPPGGYYGFATGNTQEIIFLDSVGHNPQPSGSGQDTYKLTRYWSDGSSATILTYPLAPGHSFGITYQGQASTYQGSITGNVVAYSEKWRRSFPSFSYSYSDPKPAANTGTFANDIEGIAHGGGKWYFSRTEFSSGKSVHGQVGISGNLGGPSYECTFDEPSIWHNTVNFAHYGDISYVPALGMWPGYLIVSLNDPDNHNAGLGFLAVSPNSQVSCQEHVTLVNWGTVRLSDSTEQAPAVAVTQRYRGYQVVAANGVSTREDQTMAHVYVPASFDWKSLHEYLVPLTVTPLSARLIRNTPLVNTSKVATAVAPNGLKVSANGKLYAWGAAVDNKIGRLMGIDPFNGMVHIQMDIPYQYTGGPFAGAVESEGLDIISTTDVGYSGTGAEIILQTLVNEPFVVDKWDGMHYVPDDASRM